MTVTAWFLLADAALAALLCLLMITPSRLPVPKHARGSSARASVVYTRGMNTTPTLGCWYRSTIDPQVQGKVTEIDPNGIVTVRLNAGRIDRCSLSEFADSWQEAQA